MEISNELAQETVDFLTKQPWGVVNTLLVKWVNETQKKAEAPKVEAAAGTGSADHPV